MAKSQQSQPQKGRKQSKQKLDLSTATVADGALRAPTSVYEVIGAKYSSYKERNLAEYSASLAKMDLMTLQDHAYNLGVVANANREILVDRLERKYLQERNRFPSQATAQGAQGQSSSESDALREKAKQIMSRGA